MAKRVVVGEEHQNRFFAPAAAAAALDTCCIAKQQRDKNTKIKRNIFMKERDTDNDEEDFTNLHLNSTNTLKNSESPTHPYKKNKMDRNDKYSCRLYNCRSRYLIAFSLAHATVSTDGGGCLLHLGT